MISQLLLKYKVSIVIGLGIAAIIHILMLHMNIRSLEIKNNKLAKDNTTLTLEFQQEKSNNKTLNEAIDDQNRKISKYEIDLEVKDKEYKKLISQTDKERFKKIYDQKPELEVKSNECEDIKNSLNAVRKLGL